MLLTKLFNSEAERVRRPALLEVNHPEHPFDESMVGKLDEIKPKNNCKENRYDLCEVFSRARVTPQAKRYGLVGRWSLAIAETDLVTG